MWPFPPRIDAAVVAAQLVTVRIDIVRLSREVRAMNAALKELADKLACTCSVPESCEAFAVGIAEQIREHVADPTALLELAADLEKDSAIWAEAVTREDFPTPLVS